MTYCTHGLKVGGGLILKIVGVGNLSRRPDALVSWVVNVFCSPFALVLWVFDHWGLPFAATRRFFTFRIRNRRWDPVTILLVIPVFWLLGFGVRNAGWFVLEPVIGLCCLGINDFEWLILVPVFRLLGIRIRNSSLINPVIWFLVILVINLLLRVD